MSVCMRTGISIRDELLERARSISQATGKSLGEGIEDALRLTLASSPKRSKATQVQPLKTFRGSGTLPGIDLNSSASLLEIMEH